MLSVTGLLKWFSDVWTSPNIRPRKMRSHQMDVRIEGMSELVENLETQLRALSFTTSMFEQSLVSLFHVSCQRSKRLVNPADPSQ